MARVLSPDRIVIGPVIFGSLISLGTSNDCFLEWRVPRKAASYAARAVFNNRTESRGSRQRDRSRKPFDLIKEAQPLC